MLMSVGSMIWEGAARFLSFFRFCLATILLVSGTSLHYSEDMLTSCLVMCLREVAGLAAPDAFWVNLTTGAAATTERHAKRITMIERRRLWTPMLRVSQVGRVRISPRLAVNKGVSGQHGQCQHARYPGTRDPNLPDR